jgi:hypothetical protein
VAAFRPFAEDGPHASPSAVPHGPEPGERQQGSKQRPQGGAIAGEPRNVQFVACRGDGRAVPSGWTGEGESSPRAAAWRHRVVLLCGALLCQGARRRERARSTAPRGTTLVSPPTRRISRAPHTLRRFGDAPEASSSSNPSSAMTLSRSCSGRTPRDGEVVRDAAGASLPRLPPERSGCDR